MKFLYRNVYLRNKTVWKGVLQTSIKRTKAWGKATRVCVWLGIETVFRPQDHRLKSVVVFFQRAKGKDAAAW